MESRSKIHRPAKCWLVELPAGLALHYRTGEDLGSRVEDTSPALYGGALVVMVSPLVIVIFVFIFVFTFHYLNIWQLGSHYAPN